ncbi:hypothetical protein TNCV_3939571 [Trichonephila clavipes]|uniref:Uncharacterized protein n=1 Tax=Trichonephila clavipes TaxID=2585209 RepID=A0A8X6VVN4_TRICX|nr:hypothetical protein TNCV_3939571 [Trichonephila clavipes]
MLLEKAKAPPWAVVPLRKEGRKINIVKSNFSIQCFNGHGHGIVGDLPLKIHRVEDLMHFKSVEAHSLPIGESIA